MSVDNLIDVIVDLEYALDVGKFPRKVTKELEYLMDRMIDLLDSVDNKGNEAAIANLKARRVDR